MSIELTEDTLTDTIWQHTIRNGRMPWNLTVAQFKRLNNEGASIFAPGSHLVGCPLQLVETDEESGPVK